MRKITLSALAVAAALVSTATSFASAPLDLNGKVIYENVKGVPGEFPPTFSAPVGYVVATGGIVTADVRDLHETNVPANGFSIDAGGN